MNRSKTILENQNRRKQNQKQAKLKFSGNGMWDKNESRFDSIKKLKYLFKKSQAEIPKKEVKCKSVVSSGGRKRAGYDSDCASRTKRSKKCPKGRSFLTMFKCFFSKSSP